MINATQMAKSFGREPHDWIKLKSASRYLKSLEKIHSENLWNAHKPLMEIKKGGDDQTHFLSRGSSHGVRQVAQPVLRHMGSENF
ncbi:KilA-N domain-containing protein [Bacteroidetes bacterium endosymbiont of Geopemphigus sp.]|uniref:KilA-N domain-containing protein n=1 Tax=Bacteroidetes bacterium endosymbiont of Geopemphigus sp. TaxID=2047937 RepID=UPI000CD2E3B1|nr:KilA-N domain-containing protein [Bacteroidetes bacterium endosymbiont of Geopemphigus sp.]